MTDSSTAIICGKCENVFEKVNDAWSAYWVLSGSFDSRPHMTRSAAHFDGFSYEDPSDRSGPTRIYADSWIFICNRHAPHQVSASTLEDAVEQAVLAGRDVRVPDDLRGGKVERPEGFGSSGLKVNR